MQFMNSSLDSLVKNLSNNDFKFLSEEFSGYLLELVKQYTHINTWTVLRSFLKINFLFLVL